MQKKLIALAVAGLVSGGAFAQSNVTIYGKADVGYFQSKNSGEKSLSQIASGGHDGSRLGFKGEESLGNGMKALFQLEYGLAVDENKGVGAPSFGSGSTARQQYIGLSGGFGTLSAGRVYSPMADVDSYDATDATFISAQYWISPSFSASDPTRLSNTVKYVSPSMGGFSVTGVFGYAASRRGQNNNAEGSPVGGGDQERVKGIGLSYSNGPIGLQLTHQRHDDLMSPKEPSGTDTSDTVLSGSYNFGVATVMGTLWKAKADTPLGNAKNDHWNIGVVAPVGSGDLRVMYGRTKHKSIDTKDSSFGIGYDYYWSKRTMIYTGLNRSKYDGGDTSRIIGLGMRHQF